VELGGARWSKMERTKQHKTQGRKRLVYKESFDEYLCNKAEWRSGSVLGP
jgi:hypothetical protein